MSFRDWIYIIAALVGMSFGLATGANAQPVDGNSGSNQSAGEGQTKPSADQNPKATPSIQDLLQSIASAIEAGNNKAQTAGERDSAERDLAAQEGMAKWAKYMLVIGGAEICVTLIGLLLIWGTLVHTRRAADYARDMVTEAKNATQAANDATASAKEANLILSREQRPWLRFKVIHDAVAFPPGANGQSGLLGEINAPIAITNVGKLPALGINVRRQEILPGPSETGYEPGFIEFVETLREERQSIEQRLKNAFTVLPGETETDIVYITFPQTFEANYRLPSANFLFAISITYVNDGRFYQTASAFRVSRKTAPPPILSGGEHWGRFEYGQPFDIMEIEILDRPLYSVVT
ncbi:hypothetical protein NKG95_15170 [Mesorhizobium sp. M1423]|uniref:hypothetical protein n=1 Tax=Mesorhizobium sp. M1423 TaxID=2957101 RepID=UPI003335CBC0